MGGQNNLKFNSQATSFNHNTLDINLDYTQYTDNALSDTDKNTLRLMADSFEEVILNDLDFNLEVEDFTLHNSAFNGVLAYAGPRGNGNYDPSGPYGIGYWNSTAGGMAIDPADVEQLRQVTTEPNKNAMYWVMLHEVAHAFGIGTFWNTQLTDQTSWFIGNDVIRLTEQDGAQYIGANAVREYNRLAGTDLPSLPIQTRLQHDDPDPNNRDPNKKITLHFTSPQITQEDVNQGFILHNDPWRPAGFDIEVDIPNNVDVGDSFDYTLYLTWGGHWSELEPDSGNRTVDGVLQPTIIDELMTPYIDVPEVARMSRVTIGFLHDLGYLVDYSKIDPTNT
jgi:hypothetical protein